MVSAGTVLAGRYRLEERIASGGMGEVWRGFDQVLDRIVAVKCLHAAPQEEPSFAERFRTEARTMATISHPGVVEVYDFGDDPDAGVYLVMKYIDGESLARTLARVGRLSAEATMRLVAEAAEALQAAHDKGVTHRDVKPGNLLLRSDGSALLTDFGIASSAAASGHTVPGSLLGTIGYMAPERANGQPATARSDIYSLGVVAYRCLAGRMPFAGDSPLELALRHVRDEPPPLPDDVPATVRAVVERAMAKDPAQRWASAAEFAVEARQALPPEAGEHFATVSVRAGAQPASGRRGARRVLVAAAAVLVAAVVSTMVIVLGGEDDQQPQSLQQSPMASATGPAPNTAVNQANPGDPSIVPGPATTAITPEQPGVTRPPRQGDGTVAPLAPQNLLARAVSTSAIRLRWVDASADEDGFTITNGVTSRNVSANTTTHDWDGLPPGTHSCFKVRAYNTAGTSAYQPPAESDWICATSLSGTGPAAPAGLVARALNANTIRLQWRDASTDEEGFTVHNGETSRNVGANTTAYEWGGLAPGTYMCFKVRAYNSSGVSAYFPTAEQEWVCTTTPTT